MCLRSSLPDAATKERATGPSAMSKSLRPSGEAT
ncbi:MAG: hypothetical protein EOR45_34295 [Mesorhizobium sp.]|nr:MAG: hypothetical protein EOR45_34295 [Mesorhizobium sp.]